jgi:branched-chain amino acid aminotransferase
MIILSPAKSYYSGEVKVLIAEHFSRAANGGIELQKLRGNYAAQFYPTSLANAGFQQVFGLMMQRTKNGRGRYDECSSE